MARIDIFGIEIDYELYGDAGAPATVLTPGGRYPKITPGVPHLAQALAQAGRRVLLWDRPNCGASDISFDGPSESALHVRVLGELLRKLKLEKIAVLGGSAGSRISLLTAAANPDIVSHLVIWWISGGAISMASLAAHYTAESAVACARGGMEAVVKTAGWADQIAKNPRNRDILLRQDPDAFIAKLQQWAAAFTTMDPESPVPGMKKADFERLTMPVYVFRSGKSDIHHPRRASEWVHELIPGSKLIEPPWPDQEWNNVSLIPNKDGRGRFERWPLLAPQILEFIQK